MSVPSPAARLEAAFRAIATGRMAGLPLCNPELGVEAVDFRRTPTGHWAGALITPWGINLLCLPDGEAPWPRAGADGKCQWRFPSGDYEFTRASEDSLGEFHLCSLFSPALEFGSHDEARQVARAAVTALFEAPAAREEPAQAPGRRRFLGLGA